MTDVAPPAAPLPDLPGGPYDIEFFFDPGCPFAWQTSVWLRRVVELRSIAVGWRFISLAHINRDKELPPEMKAAQGRSLRYHRVCAAARERHGNDAVGALYEAWGRGQWYGSSSEETVMGRLADLAARVDVGATLAELGLDADLVKATDDDGWDATLDAESDEAFRRTGPDVGTPILTFVADGVSLFGPVISTVPSDDEAVLALYDATRILAAFPTFAELKRSNRPPLDLPALAPVP